MLENCFHRDDEKLELPPNEASFGTSSAVECFALVLLVSSFIS
jgi:hypothetical protein